MIEIVHRYTRALLFRSETAESARAAVEEAVRTHADLRDADLRAANLRSAKNAALAQAQTCIVPAGELDVFKKTREGIVELRIPREAKPSNATGRKCRAEWAITMSTPNGEPAHSLRDENFIYRVGETVRPDTWDESRWEECSGGIHFFLTREEAEAYR